MENKTIANKILEFNYSLSQTHIELPKPYRILNPFQGENSKKVFEISKCFYYKFYNDTNKRFMIIGSSPARRGTGLTGVPFEDVQHLYKYTNIELKGFHVNKSSSNFLYDVIEEFGGPEKFYSQFYLNFVCPLGIIKTNDKGKELNCNYYDNKQVQTLLEKFILKTLHEQLSFNIDRTLCFCIGSGDNYVFLEKINNQYKLFDLIIPLEHPRFIMQYNSKNKDKYIKKYLDALTLSKNKGEIYENK